MNRATILIWLCALSLAALVATPAARADMLSMDMGEGYLSSANTEFLALRYRMDLPRWPRLEQFHGLTSFAEMSLAGWNGPASTQAAGVSLGLALPLGDNLQLTGSEAVNVIARTTQRLGTNFQFATRVAIEQRRGRLRFGVGLVHYSNAKDMFGFPGPNTGENFVVLQVGRAF